MIAELGLAALWLAAALAGLQLFAGALGLRDGGAGLAALVRPAAVVQALLCALAFGALPDLFREGKGVVAQGTLGADGVFQAREVLAKHDENYMPPEAAHAVEKAQKTLRLDK